MNRLDKVISEWNQILPNRFEFYHLGEVTTDAPPMSIEDIPDLLAIGYQLKGDIQALILVIFDKGLDVSIYSELGNVLASQTATRLHSHLNIDVMISPPLPLTDTQFETVSRGQKQLFKKPYVHLYRNSAIPVEIWVLQALPEGIGHA